VEFSKGTGNDRQSSNLRKKDGQGSGVLGVRSFWKKHFSRAGKEGGAGGRVAGKKGILPRMAWRKRRVEAQPRKSMKGGAYSSCGQ